MKSESGAHNSVKESVPSDQSDGPEEPSSVPRVVAVVLNWCNEELTASCLRSLEASTYPNLEILLVDNGSPDGSGERLRARFSNHDYLQTGTNLGYSGGNNRGIERCLEGGADYVLILNNDTEVDPDCVAYLVDTAEAVGPSRLGAAAPKMLYHSQPDRVWYGGGHFSALKGLGVHWSEGAPDDPSETGVSEVGFVTGCCCLFPESALREVGLFEEVLFAYLEDADLSLRMRQAGRALVYDPRARLRHHEALGGGPPSPFQIRQRDTNRRWVMRTHFSLLRRLPFMGWFAATRALLLLRYLAVGDTTRARAILEGAHRTPPGNRGGSATPGTVG